MYLTAKQQQIRVLAAHGYSAKEIADKTGNTINTINTHIRNIKIVRNLQKISEIAADYWCEIFGTSLNEQRKQIIAAVMCLVFILNIPFDYHHDKRRFRSRPRRESIESVSSQLI